MSITIEDDAENVGYAIIRLSEDRAGDLSVSLQFLDRRYLGPYGARSPQRAFFEAEALPDEAHRSFALGPEVTAYVREGEVVTFTDSEGRVLGTSAWEGVRPPLEDGGDAPIRTGPRVVRRLVRPKLALLQAQTDDASDDADRSSRQTEGDAEKPDDQSESQDVLDQSTRRYWLVPTLISLGALVILVLVPLVLVLSGLIGWEVWPSTIILVGPPGGPFLPVSQSARFERSWYIKPFAHLLFGDTAPFMISAAPAWLRLTQQGSAAVWILDVAAEPDATRTLTPGPYRFLVPVRFPLAFGTNAGCAIELAIKEPPTLLSIEPNAAFQFEGPRGGPFAPFQHQLTLKNQRGAASDWHVAEQPGWLVVSPKMGQIGRGANVAITLRLDPSVRDLRDTTAAHLLLSNGPAPLVVKVLITPPPPAPAATSLIDDVACDRVAGNRFDPDHPADRGFNDEVAGLSVEALDKGLETCDPNPQRHGPDRRFLVQRGRLLAERAIRRMTKGDIAGAQRDMDAAVTAWQTESEAGSSYADNFLGAYYKGTFNRSQHEFVHANDEKADTYWLRASQAGNIVAERNYAAQLLSGLGVPPDPDRAIKMLNHAMDNGDERAAGVLGVALYNGVPTGVQQDKERGWTLVKRAQCIDKIAGALLEREIARHARPQADRHACH